MGDDALQRLDAERRDPGGTRRRLHDLLDGLDQQLIAVTRAVADRVRPMTDVFLEADEDTVASLLAVDRAVAQRCTELEESGYVVLATQSPVATDLRRVLAVLRSVKDVERTGNLLGHVVASLSWVHPPSLDDELRDTIRQFGDVAATMLSVAADAWERHDALAVRDLECRDDEADLLQKVLLSELYTGDQSIEESVSIALIARYYERAADHAVELTRHLAFFLTGDRVTTRIDDC